jgi:hypothetical protein
MRIQSYRQKYIIFEQQGKKILIEKTKNIRDRKRGNILSFVPYCFQGNTRKKGKAFAPD